MLSPVSLISIDSPRVDPLRFGEADSFGCLVAHDSLWRCALKYSNQASITLLHQPGISLPGPPAGYPEDRIRSTSIANLSSLLREGRHVFLNSGHLAHSFSQTRASLASVTPIFSVLHSMVTATAAALPAILGTLMLSRPGDVVVTPSRAGAHAIRSLHAAVEGLLPDASVASLTPPEVIELPLPFDRSEITRIDKASARRLISIGSDRVVLLYLGRVNENYKANLLPILLCGRALKEHGIRSSVIIAGHGANSAYGEKLKRFAYELDCTPDVMFISDFPSSLKSVIMSAADLFISPSDNIQETFGLSLLEAMCAELPVIASDWSGYRDIVQHGETGFLVPTVWSPECADRIDCTLSLYDREYPEWYMAQRTALNTDRMIEACLLLAKDQSRRAAMGRAGRHRVDTFFAADKVIPQYVEIWERQIKISAGERPSSGHIGWRLGYNEIFGSFASTSITSSSQVRLSHLYQTSEGYRSFLEQLAVSSKVPLSLVASVVAILSRGPRRVSELYDDGVIPDWSVMMWLLKQGLLVVI